MSHQDSIDQLEQMLSVLLESHRTDLIIEQAQKILALDAENYFAYNALIHAYNRSQQFDAMYQTCQRALAIWPNDEMLHYQTYFYFLNTGIDYLQAKYHIERAIECNPLKASYYRNLGEIYLINREADKAVKFLQQAVELDPETAEYRSRLALGLLRAHKLDESITMAEQALREAPDDHQVLDTVGLIYILAGKIEKAESLFRDALRRFPTYDYYQKHIAMVEREKVDQAHRQRQHKPYTPLYLRQKGTKRFFDEDAMRET